MTKKKSSWKGYNREERAKHPQWKKLPRKADRQSLGEADAICWCRDLSQQDAKDGIAK